jgi:pyridoxamine 5'-phosphate oxidase
MVLVRGVEEGDLRFYTNRESRKGSSSPRTQRAALVFHWGPPLRRRHAPRESCRALPAEESAAYFETRARDSRLGAWASPQSRPLADRAELDALLATAVERFEDGPVPLPPFWGGYRLVPGSGRALAEPPEPPPRPRPATSAHGTAGRASGSRPDGPAQDGGASALFV